MKTKVILIVLLATLSINIFGQKYTAIDFFVPYTFAFGIEYQFINNKTGAPSKSMNKRTIYHKPTWSKNYQIQESTFMDGQEISSILSVVLIDNDKVVLKEKESASILGKDKRNVYSEPIVIFKLPEEGKTATWIIPGEKSALSGKIDPPTKCTATWTTLNFEGKNQKAIKVTSITQGENWKVEGIQYYVYKTGLVKEDSISKGKTSTLYKFYRFITDIRQL